MPTQFFKADGGILQSFIYGKIVMSEFFCVLYFHNMAYFALNRDEKRYTYCQRRNHKMPNQNNEQGNQNTLPIGHDQVEQLKHQAEQKIDETIDQFAQKVPGGTQYSQQAKDAMSGVLDNLEKEAEQQGGNILGNLGNSIGGMFGHKDEHK